ncbi:unnamed protein product [Staurois parvus]|uniref:Uncharacterized protein n=1 Tax=Staurois parvus TaxID=386267 RepID=A0ABN9E9Z5_9NEOB|nr:unnamed protein product [Staurois parvus]
MDDVTESAPTRLPDGEWARENIPEGPLPDSLPTEQVGEDIPEGPLPDHFHGVKVSGCYKTQS